MLPCSTTKTSQNRRKKKSGNRKQMLCKIVTSQELCKEEETSMAKKIRKSIMQECDTLEKLCNFFFQKG